MLVLKKELSFYDFMKEFKEELRGLTSEAVEIVFDYLCDIMFNYNYTTADVEDYLRYQMRVLSLDEVIHYYSLDIDTTKKTIEVEDYLNYNTYLLGTFEKDDELFYIFNIF